MIQTKSRNETGVELEDTLVKVGLSKEAARALAQMPHRSVHVDTRRPFRDAGAPRNEVMFVRSGILCKYKTDGSGRRQIVALRFPGEGILPSPANADYGVQAITRAEVLIGSDQDFFPIVDQHPEIGRFLYKLVQREASISHEWLVNCGRRDSTARVAHLLCETAARSGVDAQNQKMRLPFTQQQIADITGQTSVNVNRVFAELERQGLIEREGRTITFADWNEIRRVGGFQPDYLLA